MKQKASVDGINSYGVPLTFYDYLGGKCVNCYDNYGFKFFNLLVDIFVATVISFFIIRLREKLTKFNNP